MNLGTTWRKPEDNRLAQHGRHPDTIRTEVPAAGLYEAGAGSKSNWDSSGEREPGTRRIERHRSVREQGDNSMSVSARGRPRGSGAVIPAQLSPTGQSRTHLPAILRFKANRRAAVKASARALESTGIWKEGPMSQNYHAVSIRHQPRCCAAVKAIGDQRFLSTDAPLLPLADCSAPGQCRCRYKHHTDRRDDARRDTDVGLPERSFHGPNRRSAFGRRTTDAA